MQISAYLRKTTTGYSHWCPGCKRLHMIATKQEEENSVVWTFNGDVEKPSFSPSVIVEKDGKTVCHYVLINGVLVYCADCTHELASKTIPLPVLPGESIGNRTQIAREHITP